MEELASTPETYDKLILIGYAIYLPITLILTFLVSKKLFANSKVFMLDIFKGKEDIAYATNRLFEIGFYLLNIGYALLLLQMTYVQTTQGLIEKLSSKIGGFSIYLGIMLFLNLYLLFRGRSRSRRSLKKPIQPMDDPTEDMKINIPPVDGAFV